MKCVKCGRENDSPSYHRSAYDCTYVQRNGNDNEHLHYQCRCGYDWLAPTLDSQSVEQK